jgi:hypothetical protein
VVRPEAVHQQGRAVVRCAVAVEQATDDRSDRNRTHTLFPYARDERFEMRAVRRLVRLFVVVGELDEDQVALAARPAV